MPNLVELPTIPCARSLTRAGCHSRAKQMIPRLRRFAQAGKRGERDVFPACRACMEDAILSEEAAVQHGSSRWRPTAPDIRSEASGVAVPFAELAACLALLSRASARPSGWQFPTPVHPGPISGRFPPLHPSSAVANGVLLGTRPIARGCRPGHGHYAWSCWSWLFCFFGARVPRSQGYRGRLHAWRPLEEHYLVLCTLRGRSKGGNACRPGRRTLHRRSAMAIDVDVRPERLVGLEPKDVLALAAARTVSWPQRDVLPDRRAEEDTFGMRATMCARSPRAGLCCFVRLRERLALAFALVALCRVTAHGHLARYSQDCPCVFCRPYYTPALSWRSCGQSVDSICPGCLESGTLFALAFSTFSDCTVAMHRALLYMRYNGRQMLAGCS